MYENIGDKIKFLAIFTFVLGAIVAIFAGLIIAYYGEFWIGLLVIGFGPIVAWVSSWLLYGFGELIDTVSDIKEYTYKVKMNQIPKEKSAHTSDNT